MNEVSEDDKKLVRHLTEQKYNGDVILAAKEVIDLKRERTPTSLKIKVDRANRRFIKSHTDKDGPNGHKEKTDKYGCIIHQHAFKSRPKMVKEMTRYGQKEYMENIHYCAQCSKEQQKKCIEENAGYYTLRDNLGTHEIPIPNYCQRGEHIHRKPTFNGRWRRKLPNSDKSYMKEIEEWKEKNPGKDYKDEFVMCGGIMTAADNIANPDPYWHGLLSIPKPKDWQLKSVKFKFDTLYKEVLNQIKDVTNQDINEMITILKPALDTILVNCVIGIDSYPKAIKLLKEFKGDNWRVPYFTLHS